jgi:hypothetical protein
MKKRNFGGEFFDAEVATDHSNPHPPSSRLRHINSRGEKKKRKKKGEGEEKQRQEHPGKRKKKGGRRRRGRSTTHFTNTTPHLQATTPDSPRRRCAAVGARRSPERPNHHGTEVVEDSILSLDS